MKTLTGLLLMLSLTLGLRTTGYAQGPEIATLRAADVNADGVINILDLTFIASHFGDMPTADQHPNPDVNGDGTVNILDLTRVAGHLGKISGIPIAVNDATFDTVVLGATIPIVVEFKDDG